MGWTNNYSIERLEMEKSFCEIRLKNPEIYKHLMKCEDKVMSDMMFIGSMEGKIRMLDKEIRDRVIEEILLGDS